MATTYSLAALVRKGGDKRPRLTLPTIASRNTDREALRRIIVSVVDGGADERERLVRLANAAQSAITMDDIGLDGGMRAFRASQQSRLGRAADAIRGWVRKVALRFDLRWVQAVKTSLGVDVSAMVEAGDVQGVLALVTQKITTHIRGLSDDIANRIETGLIELITQGASAKAKAAAVVEAIAKARKAVSSAAKRETETLHAVMNQFRQQQAGVTQYCWWTREDERVRGRPDGLYPRVRPSHWARQGQVFSWSRPPEGGHPGEAFNCFKGSAKVDLSNGCHKLWRRFYRGALVSIETGHGRLLEATPNHPVLTDRGWLAINELQEGDYLAERSHCSGVAQADDGDFVTSFDDLFVALSATNGSEPANGSVLDFHGDGSENQIDIVSPDGSLLSRAEASINKALKDFLLARSLSDVSAGLDLDGSLYAEACRMLDATDGGMGGLGQFRSFFRSESSHSDVVGGGAVPQGHLVLAQNASDSASLDPKLLSETQDALALAVQSYDLIVRKVVPAIVGAAPRTGVLPEPLTREGLAEIVRIAAEQSCDVRHCLPAGYQFSRVSKKTISEFSGHVYNLETSTGWYFSDDFVASNCRCVARPVIVLASEKPKESSQERARREGLKAVSGALGLV